MNLELRFVIWRKKIVCVTARKSTPGARNLSKKNVKWRQRIIIYFVFITTGLSNQKQFFRLQEKNVISNFSNPQSKAKILVYYSFDVPAIFVSNR